MKEYAVRCEQTAAGTYKVRAENPNAAKESARLKHARADPRYLGYGSIRAVILETVELGDSNAGPADIAT